jgi:hypothetical protein
MPKFEIRNTSHIGGLQLKKILEQAVLPRQTVATIGEPGERTTRNRFLESRARIEVDADEERFAEWVAESLHLYYRGPVGLVLSISQLDDDESLDVPELVDSEPMIQEQVTE